MCGNGLLMRIWAKSMVFLDFIADDVHWKGPPFKGGNKELRASVWKMKPLDIPGFLFHM